MAQAQTMSLEEYKKKVEDYLTKTLHFSTAVAEELMREYEDDFPEFLEEGWKPNVAGCAMVHSY